MLKKLVPFFLSVILSLTGASAFAESPNSGGNGVAVQENPPTIEDIVPEGYDYVQLTDEEIQKNEETKKTYDELKKLENKKTKVEKIEIFRIFPKDGSKQTSPLYDSAGEFSTAATCDYGSGYDHTAHVTTSSQYDNYSVRQYLDAYMNVYNAPPGNVGSLYKSTSLTTWWTRSSTAYTVKNARIILDVFGTNYCGNSVDINTGAPSNPWTPTWKDNSTSNSWTWATSTVSVEPVYINSPSYIQQVVLSDIYKNGSKVKTDQRTTIDPSGI